MSSHKSTDNVDKAFSKLEDSLSKVQEAIPKLELTPPGLTGSLFIFEPAKKIAQWYIDTTEDFVKHGIELRKKAPYGRKTRHGQPSSRRNLQLPGN
jgi:hypothetical protein